MTFVQKSISAVCLVVLSGCSTDSLGMIMPEFNLVDTNPNSQQFEQEINPTDYLGSITGWYFGHGD